MDEFLETYNPPRLNYEDIENPNRSITEENESVIRNLPTRESPRPNDFTGEFYQTLNEEVMPIILKCFQELQGEGRLPNSFRETSISLTLKPGKNSARKENYRLTSLMNIDAKIKKY